MAKSVKLKFHERLLKSAKQNLKSAKLGGTSNKTYIDYWTRAVKYEQKIIDSLKKK
jgi:hypothetical protein